MTESPMQFEINSEHLSWEEVRDIYFNKPVQLRLSDACRKKIQAARDFLDARTKNTDRPFYGINTGFGYLCNTVIAEEDLEQLQKNLVLSHAAGAGEELPQDIVRMMLFLKIKSLAFGHSGVSVQTVERLIDFFNQSIYPVIYRQGSLGASGDLAPLAHLTLGLIGEGSLNYQGERMTAKALHEKLGMTPLALQSKEGLALLNGTQFMLATAVKLMAKTERLSQWADVLAAMSLDAFHGKLEPFNHLLHKIRPHAGQVETAKVIRELLEDSGIGNQVKDQVQDPYSFRCVPQVHGASKDAFAHVKNIFLIEINSVSDNPNIFAEEELILSGGNFHGQPLAINLDYMGIAMAELGSISERRVFQLLSGSRDLPLFLADDPGLHSGLMIAQYTAAALVSENKQLCTPASVDSIPSSNGQEDHVSMGANSAMKALRILQNLQNILGIELITVSQALSFRAPHKTSAKLQPVLEEFRKVVPVSTEDRELQPEIKAASDHLNRIPIT